MSRTILPWSVSLVALCWCLAFPQIAQTAESSANEVTIEATPPPQQTDQSGIAMTLTSAAPGNLFLSGKPVEITIHVSNTREARDVTLATTVRTETGSVVYSSETQQRLPAQGTFEKTVTLGELDRLPNGTYVCIVWLKEEWKVAETRFGVWNGPAKQKSDLFGISYHGPLNTDRARRDLDLFKLAGIGWLRLPMQGWLSQGEKTPVTAEAYDRFIQSTTDRDMTVLASFSPQVTVDPAVNPIRAEKEYIESLLAATHRYGFKVKHWELMCVSPPAYPPDMKGIGYQQLAAGRAAMARSDKTLMAAYGVENPFSANALMLFAMKLPGKKDALGFHYNFLGIPEYADAPVKPVIFAKSEMDEFSRKYIKRKPDMWVTEYGFAPEKGARLPQAAHQAAYMSRAILMNRLYGMTRTFWRHAPGSQYDLPFTTDDGAAMPSLLAVRTTLQALEGVTAVTPVETDIKGAHILMLRYKGNNTQRKTHYGLVAWSETEGSRMGIMLKSEAPQLTVTDLWGNAVELQPTEQIAMFQIDIYPRFIDLGSVSKVELRSSKGCAAFPEPIKELYEGGDNAVSFRMALDPMIFDKDIAGELRFRSWPIGGDPIVRPFSLEPYKPQDFSFPGLTIPDRPRNGDIVSEISVEIVVGTRRMGYLTLPVMYSARTAPKEDARPR